jgi:3-oxoacyl-[acyl-carrier protein] reductase
MRLHDKVAIITGSGSGFGEGVAMRFAGERAKIMVRDIAVDRCEPVADAIRAAGGAAAFILADIAGAASEL